MNLLILGIFYSYRFIFGGNASKLVESQFFASVFSYSGQIFHVQDVTIRKSPKLVIISLLFM